MIGSKLPRGSRSTLLQVGSAIVTSKLLYGIGLVSRGGQAAIQTLAPAYNRMIRFASGAFVTSTINSTMIEAGTLPFELLAAQSTARISIRVLSKDSPNLPLSQRSSNHIQELTDTAIPSIEQTIRRSNRDWHAPKPRIVWDVKKSVKAGDPPEKVRPIVRQLLASKFHDATIIYTDGDDDTLVLVYTATISLKCLASRETAAYSPQRLTQ